jgi:transposase-like protein
MEKTGKNKPRRQAPGTQILLPLASVLVTVRAALYELVVGSGMAVLQALLERDRDEACGPRYRHDARRKATRGGHAPGELVLGGRRVSVRRPRVMRKGGGEQPLPTWEAFAKEDPLTERAVEQMMLGVATRKYERSLEAVPPEVKTRGASKSAVSRRFVAETTERLAEWATRSLSGLRLAAVMIDGLVCGEHTVLIALGIDERGAKHLLGLTEGATENGAACRTLLSNLIERGLSADRTILFVIDGSKALHSSVRDAFGKRALIQRCQVHKRRNVLDKLPERLKRTIGASMNQAYRMKDHGRAMKLLTNLARRLDHDCPGAAASLREGLAETLTVVRFGLPESLERTLATTNALENVNGLVRVRTKNVRRWAGGQMVLRWVATALMDAASGFRRVKGHVGMPKLVAALRAHDTRLDGPLAAATEAA